MSSTTGTMLLRTGLVLVGLLLLGFCGKDSGSEAGTGDAEAVPEVEGPSILMITFDTTRRDFMGFAGRVPSPTPNLDALAAQSIVFEDAYTAVPLTLPSHTTLMTGLLPMSHGVHGNGTFRVPPEARTLAELLAETGRSTGAAVAAYVLDADFGLDQGFDVYDAPARSPDDAGRDRIEERTADEMVDVTLASIDRMRGRFFYWLHLFDPHAPYTPPDTTSTDRRELYEGEIRFADAEVGRLIDGLDERGLLEDLVIVFTADHGESLGDDREPTHGYLVGEHTMRVPLFLRIPGMEPRRVAGSVSLADVAPTLLSLLELPGLPGPLDGRDLAGPLNDPSMEWPDQALALECYGPWLGFGYAPFEAVVQGRHKYVRSARRELFDRIEDPGQGTDLGAAEPDVLARLGELHARRFDSPVAELAREHPVLSAEERNELESLGYALGHEPVAGRPDFDALPDLLEFPELMTWRQQASTAIADGRIDDAQDLYGKMLTKAPRSAMLHEKLGGILLVYAPDQLEDARAHFQKALRLQFERPLSHLGLAQCAFRLAEKENFELQRLIGLRRQSEAIAVQQRQQAHLREAVGHFRTVLELEPHQPQALLGAASITQQAAEDWARAGNFQRAASMQSDALRDLGLYLDTIPRDHPEWRRQDALRTAWEARLEEFRSR